MILINLLPHREAARKRRREAFYASLGAAAFVGVLIAGGVYLWYAAQISNQQARNRLLQNEIKKLEAQIKDIATLQAEIAALRARQQAVEDLQADRNMPVHLLNELVKQLPDGVYLTRMQQTNDNVAIGGVAQSNERVSELLRNLGSGTPWLARPELVEIVAGNVAVGPKETRRVSNFSIRVKLLRASEAAKAASAAGTVITVAAATPLPAPVAAGSAPRPAGSAAAPTTVAAAATPAASAKKP
ncbi:PilN domain-containing protein [Ramlibacter sp.]|uniref:PilN domain-containing protein n=1 Tax=Ramlibacter sp. TaxID=1917967 RepID=UPI0035AEBDA8